MTRRAARAAGERRDDSGDESDASAAPDVDSDDDEVPYNPKNLPLGWDGKVCYKAFISFVIKYNRMPMYARLCTCLMLEIENLL